MLNFRKVLVGAGLAAMCASAALAQWLPTSHVSTATGISFIRQEGVTEAIGSPVGAGANGITVVAGSYVRNSGWAGTYDLTFILNTINGTQLQFTSKNDVGGAGNHEITVFDNGRALGAGNPVHCQVAANGLQVTCPAVTLTGIQNLTALASGDAYDASFTLQGVRINATLLPAVSSIASTGVALSIYAKPANPAATTYPVNLFAGSQLYTTPSLAYAQTTFSQSAPSFQPGNAPAGVYTPDSTKKIASLAVCSSADPLLQTDVTVDPMVTAPKVFAIAQFASVAGGLTLAATETAYESVPTAVTNATRIAVSFSNIPAGVTVYVPWKIVSKGGTAAANPTIAVIQNGLAADGSGAGTAATAAAPFKAVANGTTVFYELTAISGQVGGDSLVLPLIAKYAAGTTPPAVTNVITVAAQLAPISSATSTAIPRFAGTAQSQTGFLSTSLCSTTLLFPYVTTQPGAAPWNTGIAISNTGSDPFSTVGQSGTCSISFYGTDAAGAAQTKTVSFGAVTGGSAFGSTAAIAPGTVAADLISSTAALGSTATFSGYAVAVCNFQYGHGYSFVIGTNSKGAFSNGYLALVLSGGATPTPRALNNGNYEAASF